MASITITRNTTLSDSAEKFEFHNLIDTATLAISNIVNADVDGAAAIADSKLATITTAGKVNTSALTITSEAQGDIAYYNGSAWTRLGAGTDGQILRTNGTSANPSWDGIWNTAEYSKLEQNVLVNAFRIAINGSLVKFNMVDGIMDEFEDESGVDTGNCANQSYDSSNDLYTASGGDMTLISEQTVAEAAPDDARIVLFEEDVDSITVNTDIKAYVSRDDGTTFTQVTLADEGDYASSKRVLTGTVDISAQPSDTDMVWKVTSHNSNNFKLHGVGLFWD